MFVRASVGVRACIHVCVRACACVRVRVRDSRDSFVSNKTSQVCFLLTKQNNNKKRKYYFHVSLNSREFCSY